MLTENDVVDAVAGYLQDQGWAIIKTATTRQRGPDIRARRDGIDLVIEAKGGTSSKPTPRHGQPFSSSQTFSHVAKALYTAARLFSEGRCTSGIALPATDQHRKRAPAIRPALEPLGVGAFLVAEDRTVHEVLAAN